MEVRYEILLIIVGCGVVTLIPRVLPLVLLSKFRLPKWYMDWLSFIPVTIMAALVAQDLLPKDGNWLAALPSIVTALITLAVACITRSLFVTVLCGVLVIALINYLT